MLNKIMLIGRVGRDPEPQYRRGTGLIVSFSLEITRQAHFQVHEEQEDELHWFNVTVFGEAAKMGIAHCGMSVLLLV
jgi:single-stranded DNA-binding protein